MALPSGYTKLEYIESTGTQCIDTGYKANNNTRIVMDFTYLGGDVVFGAYNSGGTGGFGMQSLSGAWYQYYGSSGGTTSASATANTRYMADYNKNVATINGVVARTATVNSFSGVYPMILFAIQNAGVVGFTSKLRMYSCQIYDNGTIVRSYVPCKNASGAVGLWDDVNNQFYTNAGTGAFTAGPEVQPAGPLSSRSIGSSVYLNVGGVKKEFLVVHQGLLSSLYDSSCDGTWLLMKDIYENRAWNSANSNIYETSTINTYLNGPFLGLFDSDIQKLIKQVKIPYRKGGGNGTDQSGANGLSCKVFLLSSAELGINGGTNGAKLDYFVAWTDGNSKRIAYLNGAAAIWGTRSVYAGMTNGTQFINKDGSYSTYNSSESHGIRPCIVLPSTAQVDDSGNVVVPALTAHKTLVGGTAYTVKGGKCMVDGTVYNILKGRTLIDGTGWDITFPEPLVMPAKGDLITMNLDGTDRLYRVLKVVDGTTVEVLGMWDLTTGRFGTNSIYQGNSLDERLNTLWYETLSTVAKAAIVAKSITQETWRIGAGGPPSYTGTYGATVPGTTTYLVSRKSTGVTVGDRYVYALSIQDVLDYLSDSDVLVDTSAMLRNQNIWKMFWNTSSRPGGTLFAWLRDAGDNTAQAMVIDENQGRIYGTAANPSNLSGYAARPAFQIDLSKIDFTIGGGITFAINDTNYGGIGSYQADYGMTWGDWLSSPYNSVGYTANEFNEIISPVGHGSLFDESTNKYMKPTDTIEAGKSYTIVG